MSKRLGSCEVNCETWIVAKTSDALTTEVRCFGFWERVKYAQVSAQIIQEWDGGFIVCEL
jgi:hypothetical protein